MQHGSSEGDGQAETGIRTEKWINIFYRCLGFSQSSCESHKYTRAECQNVTDLMFWRIKSVFCLHFLPPLFFLFVCLLFFLTWKQRGPHYTTERKPAIWVILQNCRKNVWLVGWLFVLRCINPFRVIQRWIRFQTIQFSIRIVFVYKQLNVKTVLFQAIQFGIST